MVFINARDDPIVPEQLLPVAREFVSKYRGNLEHALYMANFDPLLPWSNGTERSAAIFDFRFRLLVLVILA